MDTIKEGGKTKKHFLNLSYGLYSFWVGCQIDKGSAPYGADLLSKLYLLVPASERSYKSYNKTKMRSRGHQFIGLKEDI